MTEEKLVTISNSWEPTVDLENNVFVFLGSEDERYLHKKTEVSLNQTNEICLTNSTEDNNCFLEFVCLPGIGLREIYLLSNVHMVEVFDCVEGYLHSVKGQSQQDSSVSCSIQFGKPLTKISVKCIGESKSIKLNSILLRVESIAKPIGCQGSLNIPKLRSILSDLNPETSQRASSILDNIETYQKNNQTSLTDMSCLLAAAQRSTSTESNISNLLSSMGKGNPGVNNNAMYSALQGICGQVTNLRPGPGGTNLNSSSSPESVDSVVEERISQAEARILETVDERLERLENRLASKLDALLSTLSTVQISDNKSE